MNMDKQKNSSLLMSQESLIYKFIRYLISNFRVSEVKPVLTSEVKSVLTADQRFDYAVNIVLSDEGGYVNDSKDSGGETKYGISKRSYPNVDIASLTREGAKDIYRRDFWEKSNYDKIEDLALATKVFDIGVNVGIHEANFLLQRALRASGRKDIKEDGVVGDTDLAVVNASNPLILIAAFRSETAGYYRDIVGVKKDQQKFLHDWLNRAYA